MIITCFVSKPRKYEILFDRILRRAGYVKIGENAYVHEGGEQLTAAITYGKQYLPEIDTVKQCLTLYLSDAENAINLELCNELNQLLSAEMEIEKF